MKRIESSSLILCTRVAAVSEIGRTENQNLYAEYEKHMNKTMMRTSDGILGIPFGRLTSTDYNPVLQAFVSDLTKTKILV